MTNQKTTRAGYGHTGEQSISIHNLAQGRLIGDFERPEEGWKWLTDFRLPNESHVEECPRTSRGLPEQADREADYALAVRRTFHPSSQNV